MKTKTVTIYVVKEPNAKIGDCYMLRNDGKFSHAWSFGDWPECIKEFKSVAWAKKRAGFIRLRGKRVLFVVERLLYNEDGFLMGTESV